MKALGAASAMCDSATGWPKLREAMGQAQNGYRDRFLELADEYTGRQSDGSYPTMNLIQVQLTV